MENDEKTLEVQEEEQLDSDVEELVEEVTEEDTEEEEEEDDVEAKLAHAKAEAAKYRRLLEKAKKTAEKPVEKSETATPLGVEEAVLLAQGMNEELLEQLKKVAAVNGTTLIKAQNDPIFVAVKEKFEKEQKSKDASLPASKGSGSVKPKKSVSSPGLSKEEHRELAKKLMS